MKPKPTITGVRIYLLSICFVMLAPAALSAVRRATTAVEYIPQDGSQRVYWQHIARERVAIGHRESR